MEWVTVTNDPPEEELGATGEEVRLFQQYMRNNEVYPFRHQYKAFQLIRNGEECILIAGTAAGKTLAVVIPLLLRVLNGSTKKVMFLYPTLALLEDQLETIRKVATLIGYGDQIGYIYGGMSRGELITQLTKPILVATPDAVYWFIEKNVKYSQVLFYSLCHVDDIVIDEAHLLSGLMGYNLKSFLDRIQELRLRFLKLTKVRIHVLTATPTAVVHRLSNGKQIVGRSKVGKVQFRAMNIGKGWRELLLQEASTDFRRMILVLNSAKMAHQVFYDCTNQASSEALTMIYRQFGEVAEKDVIQAMEALGVDERIINKLIESKQENAVVLVKSLSETTVIRLTPAFLAELGSEVINRALFGLRADSNDFFKKQSNKKLAYRPSGKLNKHNLGLVQLGSLHFTSCLKTIADYGDRLLTTWEECIDQLSEDAEEIEQTVADWKYWLRKILDCRWLEAVSSDLETAFIHSPIPLRRVTNNLQQEQLSALPPTSVIQMAEDCQDLAIPFDPLFNKLVKENKVRTRHIGLLKGTNIPVILYTGSMTKKSRKGLIQAYQSPEILRAILISTSAVEAGVDFDADLLITQECTGSSFLQRFGRVGRRGRGQERVLLATTDGSLFGRLRETFAHKASCNREEFSRLMDQILPRREYLEASPYLEVLQAHVTRRLGEVGRIMAPHQENLERRLLETGGFQYGLRSTLPQIELFDKGIGKEPFQILAQIPSEQLHAVSNPFSVAKADVYFDQLIYMPWKYNVFIDQERTIRNMDLLLYWKDGFLHGIDPGELFKSSSHREEVFDYAKTVHSRLRDPSYLKKVLEKGKPELVQQMLPYIEAVQKNARINNYILGMGNIYLLRGSDAGSIRRVVDSEGVEITLKNQMFLLQPRTNGENMQHDADYWERFEQELYVQSYDSYGIYNRPIGHIAVDRVAGACAELYRKLVEA